MENYVPVTENTAANIYANGILIGNRNNYTTYFGSVIFGTPAEVNDKVWLCYYPNTVGNTDILIAGFSTKPFLVNSAQLNGGTLINVIYSGISSYTVNDDGVYTDVANYVLNNSENRNPDIPLYNSYNEALSAFVISINYPITYRLTNCTAPSAPTEAAVGDTVNVPLVMQQGYDIVTPSTDIVVTNNGVAVLHTYSNGTISFTMPDPS